MAFNLGSFARGAAGVAIPALIGLVAGGGRGALAGAVGGLGGAAEGVFANMDRRAAEEKARQANAAATQALGAEGPDRMGMISDALGALPEKSPLAPVLQHEMGQQLSLDDPMSQSEKLRAQELQLSELRMLSEMEAAEAERQRQAQQQQRMAAMRESLPEADRLLFDMDPQGYAEAMVDQRLPEPLSPGERFRAVGTDLYDISGEQPRLAARGRRQGEPLELVYDEQTGLSRYVPRSEAAGRIAPPKNGITVGQDAEGRPIVQIGGQGAAASLGTKARNEVESGMLDATASMERLNRVQASWRPEFNQIMPRIGMAWSAIKSKAGFNLTGSEEKALTDYKRFHQSSLDHINKEIYAATGAAMTNQEAKRIRKALPDPGEGVLDGNSPVEFKAALDGAIKKTKMAYARLAYIRKNGLPMENFGGVSLDKMGEIIDQRGMDLEEQLREAGLSGDELDSAVASALRQEFAL